MNLKGSSYNRHHIDAGVTEYKRLVKNNDTRARPLYYLHIDMEKEIVYYRRVR